ncbi:MAG: hypothetical protein ACRDHG_12350 [Anaerolineales bacterium]
MFERFTRSLRNNPARFALGLSLLLGLANAAALGVALVSRQSAANLAFEVTGLQDSLDQLQQVERQGLQGLEQQAEESEARLAGLVASFPALGEPFDLYRRGFALANESGVEIRGIETGDSTVQETPVGLLSTITYRVSAAGDFPACIDLLGRLERAGLQTLALQELFIGPRDRACDFQVIVASAVPAADLAAPSGGG